MDQPPTEQAPPDGPITVGIDGGYVRAAHQEGFFEVIAGRSVVAFRRAADDEVPESKCFGYVQTYDEKSTRKTLGFALRTPRFVRKPLAISLILQELAGETPGGFHCENFGLSLRRQQR